MMLEILTGKVIVKYPSSPSTFLLKRCTNITSVITATAVQISVNKLMLITTNFSVINDKRTATAKS